MSRVGSGGLVFNSADSHHRGARGVAGESSHVGFYVRRRISASLPLGLSDPIIASFSWYCHCPSFTHIQSISVWLHLHDDLIPDPSCGLSKRKLLRPPRHSPKQNPTEYFSNQNQKNIMGSNVLFRWSNWLADAFWYIMCVTEPWWKVVDFLWMQRVTRFGTNVWPSGSSFMKYLIDLSDMSNLLKTSHTFSANKQKLLIFYKFWILIGVGARCLYDLAAKSQQCNWRQCQLTC